MTTSFDLTGRRVLLVGGSKGIGAVLAHEFAAAGADVTIVASGVNVGEVARALSTAAGRTIQSIRCDITDRDAVARLGREAGTVDVLVNNAGIGQETPVDEPSDEIAERFRRIMDVSVNGLFWVTQAVVPNMPDETGRIIFTGSLWSKTAGPRWSAYVAAKHAVLGITRALAMELGPRGITVNCVLPGTMATESNVEDMTQDEIDWLVTQMHIRGGMIPVEALAGAYLFLASDAASEITGQAIPVDRGQLVA
jgi:NAD(P)-dependent dehydrogenase (short-subunit alcohol dehydrogenase family)